MQELMRHQSHTFEMPPMVGHAPIAISSLGRIVQCPGSLALSSPFAAKAPTEDTLEGDCAHWVAMRMAYGETVKEGEQAPNGWVVDQEMIDAGAVYVDAIESREGIPGVAEKTVRATRIHPTLCWGTPDFRQFAKVSKRIRITDFKYGHKYIEVFKNWQLLGYAAAVMEELADEIAEDEVILELVIVQPRNYCSEGPVRVWTVRASSIRGYINEAFNKAHEALSGNAKTHTGPECTHCPARHACPTLAEQAYAYIEYSGGGIPQLHDAGDMGRELRLLNLAIERLKARATGLSEMVYAKLRAGASVPFFSLEPSKPRQVWTAPAEEVLMMVSLTQPELLDKIKKPQPLVTPKEAIKAGVDAAVINQYAVPPRGTLKLTADSGAKASKIFS